jgi:trehalose/maltose hydrolase-like predicted phosphorylase
MRRVAVILALVAAAATGVCANVPGQVPQFGNGYVAAFANSTTEFIAGIFDGPTTTSTRAGLPNQLRYFFGCPSGESIQYDTPLGDGYPFAVDMETGTISLRGVCPTSGINITQQWYAHRGRREITVLNVSVESVSDFRGTLPVTVFAVSDAELAAHVNHTFHGSQNDGTVNVDTYVTLTPEEPVSDLTPLGTLTVSYVVHGSATNQQFSPTNKSAVFLAARCTSLDTKGPRDQHQQKTVDCATQKFTDAANALAELRREHVEEWRRLWARRMVVKASAADSMLPAVLEASQYALFSSIRADVPLSTSPGGLSTDGYNGHTFWDMETWMLPSLNLFQPELALGSALRYRLDRVDGAHVNALSVVYGHAGIAFPWESALTGYDVCPWPQGEHTEIHITADVMLGFRQHYQLTNDVEYLRMVYPMLLNASRFWLSRATLNATSGMYSIDGVTPPDEYHQGNNSAYTNAAVAQAVNFTATIAASLLNETNEETENLAKFARNLVIPFDDATQLHPEFDGYDGTKVKQADVVLMHFPLGWSMPRHVAENDLIYYAARTDPEGPAMTWSVFGIGYGSLGNKSAAAAMFNKGYVNNSLPPYYQWYEVVGGIGCPNFLTGAGGFLQSIWAGLGGVRIDDDGLTVLGGNTTFMAEAGVDELTLEALQFRGIGLRFHYAATAKGTTLRIEYTDKHEHHLLSRDNANVTANGHALPYDVNLSETDRVFVRLDKPKRA